MKTQNSKKLANPWLPSPNACQNKKEITENYELYFYSRKNLITFVGFYESELNSKGLFFFAAFYDLLNLVDGLWYIMARQTICVFFFSRFAPNTVSMITAHYTFIENIKIIITTTIMIMIMLPFEPN